MTQNNDLIVKLFNSQLNKLKSVIRMVLKELFFIKCGCWF